jgi:hypothetical protein
MKPWVTPFLLALERTANVSASARAAGISSATAYALKRGDADFAAAWEQALEDAVDDVEAALRDEALGVDELVVHQGQLTPMWERDPKTGQIVTDTIPGPNGPVTVPRQERLADGSLRWLTVRKRSVPAAIALLKGRRKKVFAERTEITGADGGPVQMDATARRARIASILAAAKDREGLA